MGKEVEKIRVPEIILEAYSLLLQHRVVDIIKPLGLGNGTNRNDWMFECIAEIPYPNPENIPCQIPLRVLIPEVFPLEPIEFFPKCPEVSGFPHQDAESGKLCLPEEHLAPMDASKLVCYVKWAIEWLNDAANGTLLRPGDPYELPDFSRKLLEQVLPTSHTFVFDESAESYEKWKPYIGASGSVECLLSDTIPAIFPVRFSDENNSVIRESEFSSIILKDDARIRGKWTILSDIRYERHRPPQTYSEIAGLFSNNGLSFYDILRKAWEYNNRVLEIGLFLVGFPIPNVVGGDPVEIRWQTLIFRNRRADKRGAKYRGNRPRQTWANLTRSGSLSGPKQLPWGEVENVARERMYARGSYSANIRSMRIAIFGCGALGCLIAELLARGGVRNLDLFDTDTIKFGNLCRHTLDGRNLGRNKSLSLAERLSLANPLSNVHGHSDTIPLRPSSSQETRKAIKQANLFIDCTTSETAFSWLERHTKSRNKRMVSMFFNFHAEILTLCISGTATSCGEVFQDLLSCIRNGQLPVCSETYFSQPSKEEQIIEGAGCWHPTFPALNAHIQMLVSSAVTLFSSHLDIIEGEGLAALIRRNSFAVNGIEAIPIVEVIWANRYP